MKTSVKKHLIISVIHTDDLTPVVIYQSRTGHAPAFTRMVSEFLDGRFQQTKDAE